MKFGMVSEGESPIAFSGHWIGPPETVPARNVVFLARKRFNLDRIPKQAVLRIAADSRYAAYLNGTRVGQGPARGTHKRFFVDSYEVTMGLRQKTNYLALRVYCPVVPLTSAVPPVAPAVFAQIDDWLRSDSSWEVLVDPSNRCDALFYTHHIGHSEYRDLRKDPVGWEVFEDSNEGWRPAREISRANSFGGRVLSPRDIPPLNDRSCRASRVVDFGGVPPAPENVDDDLDYASLMQVEMHLKPSRVKFANSASLADKGSTTIVPASAVTPRGGSEGAYVILDFGGEQCGNLILELEAPAGTIVDVGYDEAAPSDRLDVRRVNPNGTIYRFADRYILCEGRQRIETCLHDRGFRFLQLVLRRFSQPVTIHGVEVLDRTYPTVVSASFECDQEFLNRLWAMSCESMKACCLDLFVDCPWREQTFWLDDHFQENLFYLCMTSDPVFPSRNLRISGEGAHSNGQLSARYPSAQDMRLPVTSSNWITALSDYYLYTGDLRLVRELLPVADKALKVYEGWRDEEGLVPDQEGPGVWNFIDWGYDNAGVKLGGKTAALNMLIAAAFHEGASLHEAAGESSRASELWSASVKMVEAVIRVFWIADQRRLFDCTEPKNGQRTYSQIPHAVGIYFDLFDGPHREAALQAIVNPDSVCAELGYQQLVLPALGRSGRAKEAMGIIRNLWGPMVVAGSRTMWEVSGGRSAFTGCGSLCQGYSCAPMYFLQSTVLGVRPLKPGFAEFSLVPNAMDLRWAKGTIPTPQGEISIQWTRQSGGEGSTLNLEVTIPSGTVAVGADGRRLPAGTHAITIENKI